MKKKNLIEHLTEELIKFKAQFATEETTEVESDVEIEASAEEVEVETNEVEVEASAETETEAEVETNEVEIEASAEAEDNSLLEEINKLKTQLAELTELNIELSSEVDELKKAPAGERVDTNEAPEPIEDKMSPKVKEVLARIKRK